MSDRNGTVSSIAERLTRRGFLKGAGITAAGAAIAESGIAAFAEAQQTPAPKETRPILGPGDIPITLKVNGVEKKLTAEPRTTLAEALRSYLDLTGTKIVCDRGACSACTVHINGIPQLSCMTLAVAA